MGYANTVPLSQFELGNTHQLNDQDLTTVANTFAINAIAIPSWLANAVNHAYLDIYFPWIQNTNAATNYIADAEKIQVFGNGAWKTAIRLGTQTLALPALTLFTGSVRVVGNDDIADEINERSGHSMSIQWLDSRSQQNNLNFRMMYCILRVMTK
jgi:hypothetical protein